MAYRCVKNQSIECDGCGDCQEESQEYDEDYKYECQRDEEREQYDAGISE